MSLDIKENTNPSLTTNDKEQQVLKSSASKESNKGQTHLSLVNGDHD